MNRLWTKDGAELRPSIWRGSVDIYFEHWTRERLAATMGDAGASSEPGCPPDDPPIVVRWRGGDYRLDGRGPNEGLDKPHGEERRDVLILDIGNVAGDI